MTEVGPLIRYRSEGIFNHNEWLKEGWPVSVSPHPAGCLAPEAANVQATTQTHGVASRLWKIGYAVGRPT